jgi:hypothetical protein
MWKRIVYAGEIGEHGHSAADLMSYLKAPRDLFALEAATQETSNRR